jgi:ribosomal protein L25 (general stress protein Ctc)
MFEDGLVPGVVYGTDDDGNVVKHLVSIDRKQISREARARTVSLENTVYKLTLDLGQGLGLGNAEETFYVTLKHAQFNSITTDLFSVNYLIYRPGNRLKIPVAFVNEELNEDSKKGMFMVSVTPAVECKCDWDVPARFDVDVSTTPKRGVVRLAHVQFPPGVRPSNDVPVDLVLGVMRTDKG